MSFETLRSCALDGDAGLLGVGLLDRKRDSLPCALALERKDVVQSHHSLSWLEAEPTSESDSDRNLEGGEASEGALEAAIVRDLLNLKVVDTERGVEAEANLLDHLAGTDLLVSKLDEGSCSVKDNFKCKFCLHNCLPKACVGFKKLEKPKQE